VQSIWPADDKGRIGEQIEPGAPKVLGRVELLQRFVDTRNRDLLADGSLLDTGASARGWLREKGLV
jgi:hypothetical protein